MAQTTEKKVTKKDNFNTLKNLVVGLDDSVLNADDKKALTEFLDHEIDLVTRKRNSSSKPTAKQEENAKILDDIREVLANADAPMSLADLMAQPTLAGFTNQKLSALLTLLGEKGTKEVVKTYDKKKPYYSLAEVDEGEEA